MNGGPVAIDSGLIAKQIGKAMSDEELKAELERLRNENAALKKGASSVCLLKTPEDRESLEIFVPPAYCRGHGHNSFRARFPALVPYSSELMSVKTFACSTKLTCESDGGRRGEHFSRTTNIVRQTAKLSAFTGAA